MMWLVEQIYPRKKGACDGIIWAKAESKGNRGAEPGRYHLQALRGWLQRSYSLRR